MAITVDSTFAEVLSAHPVTASASDVLSWSTITLPEFNQDNGVTNTIKVGVFGWDMESFLEDCIVADTNCDYAAIVEKWDGWAIGAYMQVAYDSALDTLSEGVCLPDFECIGFNVEYTAGSPATYSFIPLSWKTYDMNDSDYDLSATMPDLTNYINYA